MSNSNYSGQVITFQSRDAAKLDLDLEIQESVNGAGRMLWATGSAQSNSRMLWATGSAGCAKSVVTVAA
jgi:hypothetical protein